MRFRARRLRVGIGALAATLILLALWAAFQHHASPTVRAPTGSAIKDQALDGRPAKAVARSTTTPKLSGLWVRPSAEVASRNHRRSGFTWILRLLGATESQLDRLTGGDASAVVKELKEKAQAGDPGAISVIGQVAFLNCRLGRTIGAYKSRQISEAQALSAADRDWFTSTLNDDIDFDKQLHTVCDQLIDTNEVLSWVKARADQGDGASLWLLSESGTDMKDQQQRLREASAAGFALAQYDLALLIDAGDAGAAGTGADKLGSQELLNQSAKAIPASKAELAECEYFGQCEGIPVDIDAAITHAREASQDGYFSAILAIGPHLPAGQMDPDEVEAWRLLQASLLQKGCGGNIFSVRTVQSITGTLNANNITPNSRALAERYWSDYGSQIMANLGCGS